MQLLCPCSSAVSLQIMTSTQIYASNQHFDHTLDRPPATTVINLCNVCNKFCSHEMEGLCWKFWTYSLEKGTCHCWLHTLGLACYNYRTCNLNLSYPHYWNHAALQLCCNYWAWTQEYIPCCSWDCVLEQVHQKHWVCTMKHKYLY